MNDKINKSIVEKLVNDSINSIEVVTADGNGEKNIIFACSDDQIVIYNESNDTRAILYSSNAGTDELCNLKRFFVGENNLIFAANGKFINIFDINSNKQLGKFKFCKDTINCIEINQSQNVLACGDDLGEIKLIDLRISNSKNKSKQASSTSSSLNLGLVLKKNLSQHENICFTLKYNPKNEFQLFSGSFDCSIIEWDTRFPKGTSNKPFVRQINVSEVMQLILSSKSEQDSELEYLVSSMTPSFVHSLHFSSVNNSESVLLCGIENGLCLAFNPKNCQFYSCKQLQPLNCALTQLETFETGKRCGYETIEREMIVTSGDGKRIEFAYLSETSKISDQDGCNKIQVNRVEPLRLVHVNKVNCVKYKNGNLYVADTSNSLSIYNFKNILC